MTPVPIVALDVPDAGRALALVRLLGDSCGFYKIGGELFTASGPSVVLPHIKSGKLRVLAGWGDRRLAALPDVPTFKELGYPTAEFYIWAGLFAPRATPEPALANLRAVVRDAVEDPEFKAAMAKLQTPINFKQGVEFQTFFDADARRLAEGVRRVGKLETK